MYVYPQVPFYIPFRALTHQESPNLLLAGKAIAQTFYANSATRLHPSEWSTGVAAGAAAVLMAQRGWTTSDVYSNVKELQGVLTSAPLKSPLQWTLY